MKKSRILCIALALCMGLYSWVFSARVLEVSASNAKVTEESIRQKEEQIQQAKNEMAGLKNGLSDIQKIKNSLEKEKSNLNNYVVKLDENLAELEQNIEELTRQIVEKESEIAQTEAELEQAEIVAQNQYDSMKTHIRFYYEVGTLQNTLGMLLTSDGISDFLNKADFLNRVYEYDQEMWKTYLMNCDYISLCKEQLEVENNLLNEQKQNVEEEQAQVESLIAEKQQEILAYETDISNQEKAIREYEQEIADQNAMIAEMERLVEEEKERLREQNRAALSYDGGIFKFPLANYTRISDEYGWRIHPTLGVRQFHNGVDFASPKGTAIYAAYDGVVVAASYSSSMGNYVMIDHGDGLYTIYMHASKLYVSANDSVLKGDTIAAVGSTGRSTGNHLHFSVRKNGEYVSPWEYLSK